MSKLVYPSEGLYPQCRDNAEGCVRYLANAASNCNFDIPSGFSQSSYLYSLGNKLNTYRLEASNLAAKIEQTDRSYSNLSDALETSAGGVAISPVSSRDRLII